MRFTYMKICFTLFIPILLMGCLYPDSELEKNQVPNEAQLDMVQSAIDSYQEESDGLVPIKTKNAEVPIYEKYIIDFEKLKNENFITELPGNSFENGGIYQYVLVTPDDDARVKLIDLRMAEKIRQVDVKLNIYRDEHLYPPYGEEITKGVFMIDYEKLGFKNEPYVVSPFSNENLPIIMNAQGDLFVDYRIDLMNHLEEIELSDEQKDTDLREILVDNSPFVPAFSMPYKLDDGEPVFNLDD